MKGKKPKSNTTYLCALLLFFTVGFFVVSRPPTPVPSARVQSTDRSSASTSALRSATTLNADSAKQQSSYSNNDGEPDSNNAEKKNSRPIVTENWRGAPVGDGEDTVDSYHSYDHRPDSNDPRDVLLKEYPIYRCPNNGIGMVISGQDSRYYETGSVNVKLKERNPKFVCDIHKITLHPIQPCVCYSFGSWGEVSFEVRVVFCWIVRLIFFV